MQTVILSVPSVGKYGLAPSHDKCAVGGFFLTKNIFSDILSFIIKITN